MSEIDRAFGLSRGVSKAEFSTLLERLSQEEPVSLELVAEFLGAAVRGEIANVNAADVWRLQDEIVLRAQSAWGVSLFQRGEVV